MMPEQKKLTVRVKILNELAADEAASQSKTAAEYSYHWPRIIIAMTVLALLIWAMFAGLQSAPQENHSLNQNHQQAQFEAGQLSDLRERSQLMQEKQANAVAGKGTLQTSRQLPEKEDGSAQESVPTEVKQPDPPVKVTESEPELAVFTPIKTQLNSTQVKNFTLARTVENREPKGSIEEIRADSKGVAVIYAYSDVSGLKDHILYYVWIHNGRQLARVKNGVWSNRWRSYSSKVINSTMHGDWRVELRDSNGKVLAWSSFKY
jgi:hypothetical protein